jgi:serine/threonine-protein kinase
MSFATRRYCSHCNAAFASNIDKCPRDGADLERQDINPLLGQVFGNRYQLVERLGAGGMGEVYRAEHITIGKSFAIKVLLGEVGADNNMVARFHREAKSLSLLSHRNVVSVADFGETDEGLLYLVTEFIDGTQLSDEMKNSVFDVDRTIHVIRQIGKALGHAHRRGLVHRDLKPDNVMLVQTDDEADVVKVLDFGIARVADAEDLHDAETRHRLTSQGIVMGTPAYIAPEQAMGVPLDHRADLYSLGILLYELLAGDVPFRAKSAIELMSKHLQQPPPNIERADITGKFKAVTMRLLEKNPNDRYKDVDTFLAVLDALEDSSSRGAYTRPNKKAQVAPDTDRLAMRQGSDTLLAPAVTPANLRAARGDDPTPAASLETRPAKTSRSNAMIGIGIACGIGAAIAVFSISYFRGGGEADKGQPQAALPTTPNPASTAPAFDAAPTKVTPVLAPVTVADAAVASAPVTPLEPSRPDKALTKPPPTMQALQKSVERIGGRLNKLATNLEKKEFDSLRRKWLDLATALPDVDKSVDARRKFSSRVKRLNSAIKKASRKK